MNKTKKIFWGVVILLLVLIVATAVVVGLSLDRIVKREVENVGPKITKTPVTLDAVGLSLLTGSASVKGLVIGNPEGYKSSSAISVGTAAVGVNPLSILSDKIVVRTIHVEAPEITFEGVPLGKNNLGDIMANVNSVTKNGGPEKANPTTNTTAQASNKPAKKIEVDDFLISNAKVHAILGSPINREFSLTLPPIHLTDLGKGSDGITATELTRATLSAITAATIKAVADAELDKGLKNLGGKVVDENADKIKKGFGGLLGK